MERPVEHGDPEVDHRVAGEIAAQPRVLDPLLDRRDELPRDRAAEDVVDELEVGAARQRLDLDLAVAELAVAAGLLLVPAVRLGRRRDRLAIGMRGGFRLTSTPKRRFSLATVTSMCSCPWPASSSSLVCGSRL